MIYNLEDQAHYQHIQDVLEEWERHDTEEKILENLKNSLSKVNWHKNILLKKHSQISKKSLRSLLNGFKKEIDNQQDLQHKLNLINSKNLRCKTILSKTKQLYLLTLKLINYEYKRTS